ncbi:MAG: leucine-rich repeat domain-containing protein, partial [Clostridia bacterium]
MDAKKSRNIMIIVLVTVVAVMLLATFLAVFLGRGGSNAENFLFKVDSGKAIITKYLGKDKELVIPSNLKGKKVGGFAENVFAESTLEKVEFAKNFSGEEISKNAFKDAKNLKSIILPNSIKTINEGAFENCTSLTVVKFGDNVTTFGTRAFYGCYGLSSANPDKPDVAEFVLPASTTTIEMSAFYKCSNLEKVVVGDKLTKIGESAFESCSKLVNFVVSPKNIIDTIEKSAFNDTNIISKKNAKDATVNTELNFPKLVTIGEKAFYALRGSSNFEYFSIPSTVKTIGNYAFANNMALKEIHFAKDATITSFGIGVFSDLSWLASVTVEGDSEAAMASNHFPDSITKIPSLTFSGAYRLLNEKS